MALGWKVLVRICALLLYGAVFMGGYVGLHLYLASPPSVQDSRQYGPGEGPDYFPVLVVDRQQDGGETLVLRSLAREVYAGQPGRPGDNWYLYRIPGEGRLTHADQVAFRVESRPGSRQWVEITIAEANGQRTSIYTYELKDAQVSPQSYELLASFGDNFSPLPFILLFTGLLIFLVERFLVRRLLTPTS